MKLHTWMGRSLVLAGILLLTTKTQAQQPLPQIPNQPKVEPKAKNPQPKANPNPIVVQPQVGGLPGIPAQWLNRPAFNPGPFFNPALNNPWMNQTNLIPLRPVNNPFAQPLLFNNQLNNPFAVNPFLNNQLNNPFAVNPFINNQLNNPFAQPLLFNNQLNNPFAVNPFINNQLNNPFAPNLFYSPNPRVITYTPPIAIQQPGQFLWRGPDLQVNPWSGTLYQPLSGIARTADGSLFYRVPGSGLPTNMGDYAPGSGLYYNPIGNTFLNPASGVISRPGVTNVFLPYLP